MKQKLIALWRWFTQQIVAEGWEDDYGFHYGRKDDMKLLLAIALLAAPLALLGQVATPDKDKEVRTEATLKWITTTNWTQTWDAPHVGHTHAEYPEVGTVTRTLVLEAEIDGKIVTFVPQTPVTEKVSDVKRTATFTVTKATSAVEVTAAEVKP